MEKLLPTILFHQKGDLNFSISTEAKHLLDVFEPQSVKPRNPQIPDVVRKRAVEAVKASGGDSSDDRLVYGQYRVQWGAYRGKTFCWYLSNDLGSALHNCRMAETNRGDKFSSSVNVNLAANREALLEYIYMFPMLAAEFDISRRSFAAHEVAIKARDEGLNLVGFGKFRDLTYRELSSSLNSEHVRFCEFVKTKDHRPNSPSERFVKYYTEGRFLSPPTVSPPTPPPVPKRTWLSILEPCKKRAKPAAALGAPPKAITQSEVADRGSYGACDTSSSVDDSVISLTKSRVDPSGSHAAYDTVSDQICVISSSWSLAEEHVDGSHASHDTAPYSSKTTETVKYQKPDDHYNPIPEPVCPDGRFRWGEFSKDKSRWDGVSPAQESFIQSELRKFGLQPGLDTVLKLQENSLWRLPPCPVMQKRSPTELPTPDAFWLHPFFLWMPEIICSSLGLELPCLEAECRGSARRKAIGRPRVVVGCGGGMLEMGQYYILPSKLRCDNKSCTREWLSSDHRYLDMLPEVVETIFPAKVSYRTAVCKSVLSRVTRSGRSPAETASEINNLLIERYERAHLQYLQFLQLVKHRGRSMLDTKLDLDVGTPGRHFGSYRCGHGWNGASISADYIRDCLVKIGRPAESSRSGLERSTRLKKLTPRTRTVVDSTTTQHQGKQQLERVLPVNNDSLLISRDDTTISLLPINSNVVRQDDRSPKRKVEACICLGAMDPGNEGSRLIANRTAPPDTPYKIIVSEMPQLIPGDFESTIVVSGVSVPSVHASSHLPKKSKIENKEKESESGKPRAQRICSHCKQPMSGSLHYRRIRKGEPAFMYCPIKMSEVYGTNPELPFEEFERTEHYQKAIRVCVVGKEARAIARARAQAKRKRLGWKKPGQKPPPDSQSKK